MGAILRKAKILLNIAANDNSKDEVLKTLLELVDSEIAEYCGLASMDSASDNMDNLRVQMLVIKYQRLGQETIQSHNYSGVSETFLSSYPKHILILLDSFKKQKRKVRLL